MQLHRSDADNHSHTIVHNYKLKTILSGCNCQAHKTEFFFDIAHLKKNNYVQGYNENHLIQYL